ncbi:hypothetical protein PF005_g27920 [Phytophthora fragariae]|nr:hypothetical protein PF005_g27920 [Phytophthora fragariae]
MLRTWASYVRTLDKMNPDEAMFSVLKTRYGDEVLTDMLITSRKSGTARYGVSGLEEVLLKTWLEGKNPDKLMLSVLKTRYNDDRLQSMIITAQKVPQTKPFAARMQEQFWISQDKTADDIFKLVKLDQEGENLFNSGELSTWVSYVAKLNKFDDRPDEFAVISYLQERFGDMELAKMFPAALERSGPNKNLISSLEALQFKKWQATGLDLDRLNTILTRGGFDIRNAGVSLNYVIFLRANKPRGVSAS